MSRAELEELGPIDYIVMEWPGAFPDASEVKPLLLDLVDRGIIRILDVAFVAKDEDGSVSRAVSWWPAGGSPPRRSWPP